jgi:hypothetical protein
MRDAVRPLAHLLSTRGPWLRAFGLVVLVNAVFLLLALSVALVPREPLVERIQVAFASGELIEDDWPGLESRRGFNQYLDCSILQMISNRDDNLWANAAAPLIYNKNRGEIDRCAVLRRLVDEGPNAAPYLVYRYTRYWHGYNPVSAVLLWAFDLGHVRNVLKISVYGALVLLGLAAGTRSLGLFTVAGGITVTGVLFWALPYFGQSLSQAPGDAFVMLGLAGLLFCRERLSRLATLVPYCAAYGAGVAYLEFLTGQLPTAAGLLLSMVYLTARLRPEPGNEPMRAWRLALAGLLAFALGVALTVAIKQALAAAIVGPDALRSFHQYLRRYVNPSPGASLAHFRETWASPDDPLIWSSWKAVFAVLSQGHVLTYGSGPGAIALYTASALAWLAAGYLTFRRRVRWALSDFLGFAAGVAIILAWIWSFQTHTTIHKWWMVRMLIVPLSLGWGALAWQLITVPRQNPVHLGVGEGEANPGQADTGVRGIRPLPSAIHDES